MAGVLPRTHNCVAHYHRAEAKAKSRRASVVAKCTASVKKGCAFAAAVLLTVHAPAHAEDYEQELRNIVKSHGTDLAVRDAPAPAKDSKLPDVRRAPPAVTVKALETQPRKELIRAEALFESKMAGGTGAPPNSASRPGLTLNSTTASAALSVLGVLGSAAGAAGLLAHFNNSPEADSNLVGTGPLPGTGVPPPQMPLISPDESEPYIADVEDKSPTAV